MLEELDIPFRMLVERVPGVTYVCAYDDEGTLLYLSPQVEELTGHPPEYFVRHPERWRGILHPDDRDRVMRKIAEDVQDERPFDAEYRIVHADGRVRTLWDRETLIPGEDGRPAYSQGVVVDLTELRAAESAVRDREEWNRSVLAALAEGLVVFDRDGAVVACNDGMAEIVGVRGDQIVGSRLPFVPTFFEDGKVVMATNSPVTAVLRTRRSARRLSLRLSQRGGPDVWVTANFQPLLRQGECAGVVCSMVEVTERRLAEDNLRRRLEQQEVVAALGRQVIDAAPLVDLVTAAASGLARGLGAFGVAIQQDGNGTARALEARAATPPDPDPAEPERVAVQSDRMTFAQILIHPLAGEVLSPEDRTFVESVANVLAAAFARDGAQRLQERLQRARRLDTVGQLAGGMAHDFNNLLVVIQGYARYLAEALDDRPDLLEDLGEIMRAADRGAELTRRLLTFSRRRPARLDLVDLTAIATAAEAGLRRRLGDGIELRLELAPEPCTCLAEAGQLEQALDNLVLNARDAMPGGGVLTVSTKSVEADYVLLSVADTGVGMADEVVDRAFEPFFSTKADGVGLGLAIVYGIVTQAGGDVLLESSHGAGTTVNVRLPFSARSAEAPAERSPEPAHGEHVLVVEDDGALRALAERMLRDGGYRVTVAADGHEALAAIERELPDLLLTDVVMPEISGPTLAAKVRAEHPDLPVVFMSGFTPSAGEHAGLSPDAPLLAKPFSSEALLATIARSMKRP